MRRITLFTLILSLLLHLPCAAAELAEDEALLNEVKIGSDGPSVVAYFKKRTLPDGDLKRVEDLVRQLGHDDFEQRERATGTLITLGPSVAPHLKQALADKDAEIVYRARFCLDNMERVSAPTVVTAAMRVLASKEPDKAAELLLAYAPQAESSYVLDAIRDALKHIAVREKKPDATLQAGLKDRHPLRRGLAAEALIRAQGMDLDAAGPLLKDDDVGVRLRVALALIDRQHKDAVPALIGLYKQVSQDQVWQLEDALFQIAGDNPPKIPTNVATDPRGKAQQAWEAWWKANGDKVDLKSVKERPALQGLTLVCYIDPNTGWSRIVELGRDNKVRWELKDLQTSVVDMQHLPNDHLLLVEVNTQAITERNRKGEIVWQHQISGSPLAARRLADGNTFIAYRNGAQIVDRKGAVTMTYTRKTTDIVGATALPKGEFLLVTRTGQAIRVDKTGKEVKTFAVERVTTTTSLTVTPKGTFLLPTNRLGKIIEYDLDGNTVETTTSANATLAQRLPNGNTLIGSRLGRKLIELDREGKTVSSVSIDGNVMLIQRR